MLFTIEMTSETKEICIEENMKEASDCQICCYCGDESEDWYRIQSGKCKFFCFECRQLYIEGYIGDNELN